MLGSLGPLELGLILAIMILLFGVGRVSRIGGEMGSAIREFRKGLKGDGEESAENQSDAS
ncbi:MAG: twin-arginine translocase TatA/TatE family subunit [Chloroflexi bacterium]|nr:twin-arginine translocase TatA/TatE family subunit [Chloroflexota bacterium]